MRRTLPVLSLALNLTMLLSLPARAATITGTVKNEAGSGLGSVDLDFIDLCTGDNIFLTNDTTAPNGTYSVVVPNGTYDIHYTPPAGSTVAAGELTDRIVSGGASLGVTTLHPGRLVSGTVKTPAGVGLAGVDLKFVDQATQQRVYLTNVLTNGSGQYSARVLPGTWNIDYRPPVTAAYTDVERIGLVVSGADISGLVNTLGTGFNETGVIQDKQNAKIKNVDLDFYDQCTGLRVATAHDNSDANGAFSVYVPPGTYTVNYDPPRCKPVEAARFPGEVIDRTTNMGTTKLKDAVLVSGIVVDHMGQPAANVKLKFFDATAAGTPRQATTSDRTDAAGAFSIYLPPSTFNINFEPPAGSTELVATLSGVVVVGATNLGTVPLAAGLPVSGHVTGPGNPPVLNVNVNAVDSATRVAVSLSEDDTDGSGNFTVAMPAGTYDIQYDPPSCTGFAPASQNNIVIGGATALPTMNLIAGVHTLGTVIDTHALPVANVDLDFYPAGQALKSYTPRDSTAVDGSYDVTVQPGAFDINYIPATGSRLRPAQRLNQAVPVNTTLPLTVLADGWLVSGFVKSGVTLAPIAGVTVDFFMPGATLPLWTNHHVTAVDGSHNIAVDAGTWDILFTPAAGSAFAPLWRLGVVVASDISLGDTLLSAPVVPSVTGIAPASGTTAGGQPVTLSGSGFQTGALVLIGGVAAGSVTVVSGSTITALTPAHPPALADVSVVNPGSQAGIKPLSYTFVEPATPVRLMVTKSGGNIVLTWQTTGQPSYTVFRNGQPFGFSGASILVKTPSLTFTDTTSSSALGVTFYQVD